MRLSTASVPILSLALVVFFLKETFASCPKDEAIYPCSCEQLVTETRTNHTVTETFVTCKNIPDASTLFLSARGMANLVVHKFLVFHSNVGYLPSNMLLDSIVTSVQVYHSKVSRFTEGNETAFLGQESSLVELVLVACELDDDIELERLSVLTELRTLDLSSNAITAVYRKWFHFPPRKLEILSFKGNRIDFLEPEAFAQIKTLRSLDLSENRLKTVERNVLPTPASFLEYLYLSYNELVSLPRDFFKDTPIIKKVYLDYNKFRSLPNFPYEELWNQSSYLSHVDLLGNDILCDTSLCWFTMRDEHSRNLVTGSCSDPDKLRGRRLRTLWPWYLECNETIYHGNLQLSYRAKA